MKGNRRSQPPAAAPSPPPASPTTRGTAKYTNKDGSKFITVPKPAAAEPPQPSPPAAEPTPAKTQNVMADPVSGNGAEPPVNRKKAKRRAKAAAKAKAEEVAGASFNGVPNPAASAGHGHRQLQPAPGEAEADDSDDDSGRPSGQHAPEGHEQDPADAGKAKKTKKKKKKDVPAPVSTAAPSLHGPPPQSSAARHMAGAPREKIWNTNSQEERERIKEFWLGLGEEERKSLVKVEKDAVLKKMKEQQKHTCSCSICGRKRTAIEEELEGLYDAYYEELEQYAHDPNHQGRGPPLMGPPRHFSSTGGLHSPALASTYSGQQPSRGRIVEHVGDDEEEDGDEEYCDDDDLVDEDDYSEGDEDLPPDDAHRDYASDFFNFGNSLQVHGRELYSKLLEIILQYKSLLSSPTPPSPEAIKHLLSQFLADFDKSLGGILTVADDLLKNDGRKFIEMMEQLAERRMAREEDVKDQFSRDTGYAHGVNGGSYGHNRPPSEEDYGPEEEDDEEYESQEEEYEEEEDTMTEEQRMEEGRRMFQIFAARMFEQRVLTAYREKVAKERQEKLLEELADEASLESQRKAKKAKEAQKRKDKAAQKKQALAEEKARKEAEKAAEEAQRQAEEARRVEEQRQKAEEKRKKKEAQRKAEEEERLRKEAERLRRIHEQKERQAEQERKAREAKEREKKLKEEARVKEQEARERKERESRERKEKQEQDKREKEARARANQAKEKQKQEERAAQKAAALASTAVPITLPKRPSQHPAAVPALPQQPPTSFASPQIAVATPALPKAATPIRPRQPSQQAGSVGGGSSRPASQSGSAPSQNPTPNPATPVHASPGSLGPAKVSTSSVNQATMPQAQAVSPLMASTKPALQQPSPFNIMPPPMGIPFPLGMPPVGPPPGFSLPNPYAPMAGGSYRAPGPPPMIPMPSGMNGPGRGYAPVAPPPGFGHASPEQLGNVTQFGSLPKDGIPSVHSRQPSAGFESASAAAVTQPIARPTPIGRPASVVHGQRTTSRSPPGTTEEKETEDPHHLGSKALLDDSDFPLDEFSARRPIAITRPPFGPAASSFAMDPNPGFAAQSPLWNNSLPHSLGHSSPFSHGPPPGFHMGGAMSGGWGPPGSTSAFAPHGSLGRSSQGRSVTLRQILCEVCKRLSDSRKDSAGTSDSDGQGDGFIPIDSIKPQVKFEALAQNLGDPVQDSELANLYDTEGNSTNGGGNFDMQRDESGEITGLRWVPNSLEHLFPRFPDAVSPIVGSGDGSTLRSSVGTSR